jgi:hypothetical protein
MGATTRCPYCNHSIIVPKELREKEQNPGYGQVPPVVFSVQTGDDFGAAATGVSNAVKWIVGIVGVVVVVSVLAAVVVPVIIGAAVFSQVAPLSDQLSQEFAQPDISATISSITKPLSITQVAEENGLSRKVMEFGSEGTGTGRFTDVRSIALDGAGNIYVGEYSGGRIQVFDGNGTFTTQWNADTKMPLRDLAADLKGTVYVVQKGDINRFEGATGKALGKLPTTKRVGFDKVTIGPDGAIYGAGEIDNNPVIVIFKDGKQVKVIENAFGELEFGSDLGPLAVDGNGNIFVTIEHEKVIIKVSPDGKYVNRFGGKGNEPGLFQIMGDIAIDGSGKIYVNNIGGVDIFDSNGRYIDTYIKDPGGISGFVIDDKDRLVGADRTKVVVYENNS